MQRSCSGHLLVFPCDSGVRLWDAEIQAKVDYCYVWRREETRRVHFPRTWNQTGKPVLTDYCTAAKTRAAAHHVIFSSTKHPQAQHDYIALLLVLLRVLRYVTQTGKLRVGCDALIGL